MYFKLSCRNVRKSFSDYTLYFLTLSFGVCVFYVFNSIEAQQAMLHISKSALQFMKTISQLMNAISIFVSFILGFLIVYANNFLIRRRKREFGIYMTLGMEKRKVARILISETFLIGIFSLAVGLCAGIFASQGLSIVTAKLFQVNMTDFKFIFSLQALVKTILYFGIIFLIVIAASTVTISKYKLINLINSAKQNERPKVKNSAVTVVLFVLAIACIGAAYKMVLKNGIMSFDKWLVIELILGAVGTFLLFASLSGFLLKAVQANKRLYYKGLNMFLARQINNRINTTFISMSFICLMLFFTIGIFSTGMGMTSVLNRAFKDAAPFDISLSESGDIDIQTQLADGDLNLSDYAESAHQYRIYEYQGPELTLKTIFQKVDYLLPADNADNIKENIYPLPLHLIRASDYNALMALQNKDGVSLSGNQVALQTQFMWQDATYQACLDAYIAQGNTMTIGGQAYSVYPEILSDGITNESYDMITLVIPDDLAENGTVFQSVLCFNCSGDSTDTQDAFVTALQDANSFPNLEFSFLSKNEIMAQSGGSKAIISFVGIYVGIIFLITSAAVLALQQLSEAADNRRRYAVLIKIGADNALLRRTIFKQTAIYFLMPLALACIHDVVGIKVANDAVRQVGSLNAAKNILVTAVLILVVYGAYFIATYIGNRNIILKGKTPSED